MSRSSLLFPLTAVLFVSLGAISCARQVSKSSGQGTRLKVPLLRYLSNAPLMIAREEGFFGQEGLEVDLVPLDSLTAATPALIRGEIDMLPGLIKFADLNAIAQGARIRIVADKGHFESGLCAPVAFVLSKTFVEKNKGFAGARVACDPLSFSGFVLHEAFGQLGVSLTGLKWINIKDAVASEALGRDELDMAYLSEPTLSRTLDSNKGVVWKAWAESLPGDGLAYIIYGPRLVEKEREAGVHFMVAYLRGVRQYLQGKTPRNLDILSRGTGLSWEFLQRACWQPIRDTGVAGRANVMAYQRWGLTQGHLRRELRDDEIFDTYFTDEANRILAGRQQSARP